jgi:hypothetical protein
MTIELRTDPSYPPWQLSVDGPAATLTLRVTPVAGLRDDYELKLDLQVRCRGFDSLRAHPGHSAVSSSAWPSDPSSPDSLARPSRGASAPGSRNLAAIDSAAAAPRLTTAWA